MKIKTVIQIFTIFDLPTAISTPNVQIMDTTWVEER